MKKNEIAVSAEVIEWIRSHAVRFPAVCETSDELNSSGLCELFQDISIVLLGEATHGTREFFRLKAEIFEYLVKECEFRVFAIEAGWGESIAINHYIRTGEGDPAEILRGLGYWVWNTYEVLELILWMRKWNESSTPDRIVQFWGVDMQTISSAVLFLEERISNRDPRFFLAISDFLRSYQHINSIRIGMGARVGIQCCDLDGLEQLTHWVLYTMPLVCIEPLERLMISQALQVFKQFDQLSMCSDENTAQRMRDYWMALNVVWIQENIAPAGKVALWAHNDHIQRCVSSNGCEVLGWHLARKFSSKVLSVGFFFGRGGFQAVAVDECNSSRSIQEIIAGPAPIDSLEGVLSMVGPSVFCVDLRQLPDDGDVTRWFAERRRVLSIGSDCDLRDSGTWFHEVIVGIAHDILVFVPNATRARSIPNRARVEIQTASRSTPENLDFVGDQIGNEPSVWLIPNSTRSSGYFVSVVMKPLGEPGNCVRISGGSDDSNAFGRIVQRIQGISYRGKTFRFSANLRTEGACMVGLWIRVDCVGGYVGFFDNMSDRMVRNSAWAEANICGVIDQDAVIINFGVIMVGIGAIWADGIQLEFNCSATQ